MANYFVFFFKQGYYRKGEVEFATQHYGEALDSYRRGSQLQPDPTLLECVLKASRELKIQEKVYFAYKILFY